MSTIVLTDLDSGVLISECSAKKKASCLKWTARSLHSRTCGMRMFHTSVTLFHGYVLLNCQADLWGLDN